MIPKKIRGLKEGTVYGAMGQSRKNILSDVQSQGQRTNDVTMDHSARENA
jgi:hypothetical protein